MLKKVTKNFPNAFEIFKNFENVTRLTKLIKIHNKKSYI